jgi:hypothetical protein
MSTGRNEIELLVVHGSSIGIGGHRTLPLVA